MSALLRVADGLAMAGVGALLAVVAGAILARLAQEASGGALNIALPGHVELARHALMVAMLSALPGAAARGLVRVDLLTSALAPRAARALDRLWALLLAAVALAGAWRLAGAGTDAFAAGEVSQVLGYPLWPLFAHGAAALAMLARVGLAQAVAGR